jgi:Rieske 2Fe-2S family protein
MKPAPLDQATVTKTLAPFGSSTGLPAAAYRSPEVLAWEAAHLFAATWFCLGRVEDLLHPGQARAVRAGDEAILLVRDSDEVRVFSNVCRHRGHELAPVGEAFDTRFIRCPYHAWTYRLDGTLMTAPTFSNRTDFEEDDYPLISVDADIWEGWLFVNLDGQGDPINSHLGNLDTIVGEYGIADLATAHRQAYEVEANWKLLAENYNECYHCTSIHPALCEVTPVSSGTDLAPTGLWCGGTMDLKPHAATMSLDGSTPQPPLRGVAGERLRQVVYVTLFPNLLISAHPDYVLAHRLVPLAPDRTAVECTWLFPAETVADPSFDPSYAVDFWDLTNREDWTVCEGVQRGMANSGYRQGPLSTWEATVYQFLTMIGRAYLGEGLTPSPVEERVISRSVDQ